jgi:hypothetical protein
MTAGGTVDVRNRASEFKAKIVPCVFRKPAVTSIASPRLALIDSANRADLVVLRRVRRPRRRHRSARRSWRGRTATCFLAKIQISKEYFQLHIRR